MSDDPFYAGLEEDEQPAPDLAWPEVRVCEPGEAVEPVTILIRRQCEFVAKPCKLCGKPKGSKVHTPKKTATCAFKRQNGCATCGLAKSHIDHAGAPESFNIFASGGGQQRGGGWEMYQSAKKRQEAVLRPALLASGLPKGLARVVVEGECSFGDAAQRDQGNFRVIPEKALGDLLKTEGFLPNDKWAQYEFGNLALKEDGENWLRLTLFPSAPEPEEPPAQGALL